MLVWVRSVFLVLFSFSFPAYSNISVDSEQACQSIVRAFGVSSSSPQFSTDIEICEQARKTCKGVKDLLYANCAEQSSRQAKSDTDWASNMLLAQQTGTIIGMSGHMTNFCPTYTPELVAHMSLCDKVHEVCGNGEWTLSSGKAVTCQSFSVLHSEVEVGNFESYLPLCEATSRRAVGVREKNEDRMRMCGEYADTYKASEVGSDKSSMEQKPVHGELDKGWDDGSHPGWEEAPPEISDADLEYDLVPVEDKVQEHLSSQGNPIPIPTPRPMPGPSEVNRFFNQEQ